MGSYSILKTDNPIVFFDTSCLLCNKSVQLLLAADKRKLFTIAGLSSDIGVYLLSEYKINEDSIILYHKTKCSTKSNAFLAICYLLGFPYSLMVVFYIIPEFIRDWVYDIIAGNRKKWFGRTNHCIIHSKKYSGRIIL